MDFEKIANFVVNKKLAAVAVVVTGVLVFGFDFGAEISEGKFPIFVFSVFCGVFLIILFLNWIWNFITASLFPQRDREIENEIRGMTEGEKRILRDFKHPNRTLVMNISQNAIPPHLAELEQKGILKVVELNTGDKGYLDTVLGNHRLELTVSQEFHKIIKKLNF